MIIVSDTTTIANLFAIGHFHQFSEKAQQKFTALFHTTSKHSKQPLNKPTSRHKNCFAKN
jgi:hypothetical protein